MAGLTTIFNWGRHSEKPPIYQEKDYTSDFGILKDLSNIDWVNRIIHFIPQWIRKDEESNTYKIIKGIVGGLIEETGVIYVFKQLKELIRDSFLGSAINEGLNNLAIEYTKLVKHIHEHDWHLRYRIYELLFEMKPTRSNLDRLIIKWLGTSSVERDGTYASYVKTVQQYSIPETYHYYVTDGYYKDLEVYKDNFPLIKGVHYEEVGKIGRKSRTINFIRPILNHEEIKIKIKNHNPVTEFIFKGEDLEVKDLYEFALPSSHKYIVGVKEDVNIRIFKNNEMLRRFDDYLEVGIEGTPSQIIYVYNKPLDTDNFRFEILGHFSTEGYHMYTTKHHILEQKDYGFYSDGTYLCTSSQTLELYSLVNFDNIEKTAIYANADVNINKPAMGIVTAIIGSIDQPYYVVQTKGNILNNERNDDRTLKWNFTVGNNLYLDTFNGRITETAPTPPNLVQVIGKAIKSNEILLDNSLYQDYGEINTFFNSPTGKFNKNATVFIVVKNAKEYGADFYNYQPMTAYYDPDYASLILLGYNINNIEIPVLMFKYITPGPLTTNVTVTVTNGTTTDYKKIIINQGQPNEEIYNDVNMLEEFSGEYIVDVINNNSLLVRAIRLTELDDNTLPYNVSGKRLYNNRDSYYEGTEPNISQNGLGFYGIDNTVHLNGFVKDSLLDNLQKEVSFSKPVGVHVYYELHPKQIRYLGNRYIHEVGD